jgi:hypothetical protein
LAQEIHLHLQTLGLWVCAEDIVKYMSSDEMKARLNLKNGISLRTAQRSLTLELRFTGQRCGISNKVSLCDKRPRGSSSPGASLYQLKIGTHSTPARRKEKELIKCLHMFGLSTIPHNTLFSVDLCTLTLYGNIRNAKRDVFTLDEHT